MNICLKIVPECLNSLDLKELFQFSIWHSDYRWLNKPAGTDPYRLYSYLSWQFPPNITLIDIGTFVGNSALALSHNPNVKVISYNIQDDIGNPKYSVKNKSNIELRIKNCIEDIDILLKSPLILLDTMHNGDFEKELIELLIKNKYNGIVICDDIYLNNEMKLFWDWVPIKKIDLTNIGHWSGTGAIIFDEKTCNLEIINN